MATKMTIDEDTEPSVDDLLMFAWGVIANAGQGDWERESAEWREAARKWRDGFHKRLRGAQRCPSCDHTLSIHQRDGCWFTVETGLPGENLVCPCTIPIPAEPTTSATDDRISQLHVLNGEPLSGGDFEVRLTTDQISLIAWALQRQANELTPYAWGQKPSQELAIQFAALSGDH